MQDNRTYLYQVFAGGQAAWIVHYVEVADDQGDAIHRTADPALDPRITVILESEPEPYPEAAVGDEAVTIHEFENQRLVLQTTLSSPGVVVLSEVAYPGWEAYVDGQRLPTLRAHGLLRAVALPAGEWLIEWSFNPMVVWNGLGISVITGAIVIVLLGSEQWKKANRSSLRNLVDPSDVAPGSC
jgi:hypothetical protein